MTGSATGRCKSRRAGRHGAGVATSIATAVVAALADAAGVSLDISGEEIPLSGFATLTMVGAVLGVTHIVAAAIIVPPIARRLAA
ncbi:MAG: DUF6069 family protein [Ilumatobacteraceae bacterium]